MIVNILFFILSLKSNTHFSQQHISTETHHIPGAQWPRLTRGCRWRWVGVRDWAPWVPLTHFLVGNQGPRNSETYLWQSQGDYLGPSSVFLPLFTLQVSEDSLPRGSAGNLPCRFCTAVLCPDLRHWDPLTGPSVHRAPELTVRWPQWLLL